MDYIEAMFEATLNLSGGNAHRETVCAKHGVHLCPECFPDPQRERERLDARYQADLERQAGCNDD